jgi:hypothetical protein
LPPSIKELAKVDLLTKAESGPCPTVLSTTADTGEGASSRGVQAFLQTGEGEVLAGRFTRAGAASECWFLPEYADPVKWVLAALREWDLTVQPDARSYDDGPAGDRWLTPREAEAIHHREVLRQKIEDFLRDIRGQIARVEDELREAKEIADRRERRLLRARGQELLEPAHQGLAALGFTTEEWGSSEADERVLIVSDPEGSGGWQAVVQASTGENAPSLKDLLRLYRIRSKYAKNFGTEPSAVWCIFNRFPEADSSEMPELVATYPDEIAVLAGDGGLLLDTTALFDIWIAVQRRKVSAADARRLLITARGCLTRKDVESFTVEKHDVSHS